MFRTESMARGDNVSVRAMKLPAALLTSTSSGAFAQIFSIIVSIAAASRTSQLCVSIAVPVACFRSAAAASSTSVRRPQITTSAPSST
jgi:hypothetical protein